MYGWLDGWMDGGRDGGREGARDDACVDGWMDVCTVGIGSLHSSPCIVADAGPEAMNQTRDTTGKKRKSRVPSCSNTP